MGKKRLRIIANFRCHDTQHNDTRHNDIQHNELSIKGICDTQHKVALHYAECGCAEGHILSIAMLSVVILNVVVQSHYAE